MRTAKKSKNKPNDIQDQSLLVKFISYNYSDFTSGKEIKSKSFILMNSAVQDKRILSSVEEVKFAGRYVNNPIILGFKCLADAKRYLAGPRVPLPGKKDKKEEFYSDKPHEQIPSIKQARIAHEKFARGFKKG